MKILKIIFGGIMALAFIGAGIWFAMNDCYKLCFMSLLLAIAAAYPELLLKCIIPENEKSR